MEHEELVKEMKQVEKMTTAERLKYARKKRQSQLKKHTAYDKQHDKKEIKKCHSHISDTVTMTNKKEDRVNFVGEIILLEAAGRNDLAEVRDLLYSGISPDAFNDDGLTALHQCCIDDQAAMMHLLVEFGANVNATDTELWTPLHAAATCCHSHLCKYLIDYGATILAVNSDGNMPYDIAESDTLDLLENEMSSRGVTQELIESTRLRTEKVMLDDLKSKNMLEINNFVGKSGETLLHIAAANGYVDVIEFLLSDSSIDVNTLDNDNWRPIHAAACWGQPIVLEMLVRYGAQLQVTTKTNETPYDICEDEQLKSRIQELLDEQQTLQRQQQQRQEQEDEDHRDDTQNDPRKSLQGTNARVSSVTGNLARKRSQNSRSASIRRTSMREKTQIHQREAADEATRMMEKSDNDDVEEDDSINSGNDFADKGENKTDSVNNNEPEELKCNSPVDAPDRVLTSDPVSIDPESSPVSRPPSPPPPAEPTPVGSTSPLTPVNLDSGDTPSNGVKRTAPISPSLSKHNNVSLPRANSPSHSVTSLSMINAGTYNLSEDSTIKSGTLADLKKTRNAQRILHQQKLGHSFENLDLKEVDEAKKKRVAPTPIKFQETDQGKGQGCCVIN